MSDTYNTIKTKQSKQTNIAQNAFDVKKFKNQMQQKQNKIIAQYTSTHMGV